MSVKTKSQAVAPKRGRGRPASFPGVETVAFPAKLPLETRQMVRDVAAKRGENIDQTLNRFILAGFKSAMRNRKAN